MVLTSYDCTDDITLSLQSAQSGSNDQGLFLEMLIHGVNK